MRISAIIPALDEEQNIGRCLQSLRFWVDEIIVIDAGSNDKTSEIASLYADILCRGEQIPPAIGHYLGVELATGDWIFIMGADHEVPYELKCEIVNEIAKSKETGVVGFRIPILEIFYNNISFIVGTPLRLCRKDKITYELVTHHFSSSWKVYGPVKKLKFNCIHHRNHDRVGSLHNIIIKTNINSTDKAEERFSKGDRFNGVQMVLNPLLRFYECIWKKKYYRMGAFGLFLSINNALSKYLEEMKLWELSMD